VIIVTQDLRAQCRVASGDHKPERDEPSRSPKKKFFGMSIPNFGKNPNHALPPRMPSKAAQVLGEEPRNPTIIPVRPIKPAGSFNTPTKASRSDTSKSLPAKILDQDKYARSHYHKGTARRKRASNHKSPPGVDWQFSDVDSIPPVPKLTASSESMCPPTPPAKDTPPEKQMTVRPASPLRRAAPSNDLRESYETHVDKGMKLQFPVFALSPSPSKATSGDSAGKSPTKYLPCTADQYQKLIAGVPLPFSTPMEDDFKAVEDNSFHTVLAGNGQPILRSPSLSCWSEGQHHILIIEGEAHNTLQQPVRNHWSEGEAYGNHDGRPYSLLAPRFYSPPSRSFQLFAEGETPSKNVSVPSRLPLTSRLNRLALLAPTSPTQSLSAFTSESLSFPLKLFPLLQTDNKLQSDHGRLLYTVAATTPVSRLDQDSSNDSIEIVFQGNRNDIDPDSPTGRMLNSNAQEPSTLQANNEAQPAVRNMQEPRLGHEQDPTSHPNGTADLLQPDQSSSRLTDMLHGVSPGRGNFDAQFQPHCPSAVPSPLHRAPVPIIPSASVRNSFASWGAPRTPQNIDDHFFMTNEHLDVVGKSTYDWIDKLRMELQTSSNDKQKQLVEIIDKHFEDIKKQVILANEKADRNVENGHTSHAKLDSLFDFVRHDVVDAMEAQDRKVISLVQGVQDLQKSMQNLQKMLEQKMIDPRTGQQQTATIPPPHHGPQPYLTTYYGNVTESGHEGPPNMPNNVIAQGAHNDSRAGFGNHYGQQWGPRSGYRSSNEDRTPYSGTNPYHFGNSGGMAGNGGQYNNGPQVSGYNLAPSPPDQPYRFNK
jgi:hypothetical protein